MTYRRLPECGLYAITPDRSMAPSQLLDAVEEALRGGARLLQYRRKGVSRAQAKPEIEALVASCERYDALLFVNDDVELARSAGAHGVHLGRDDGDYTALARDSGRRLLLGVSCYDSLTLARSAADAGVDYIAFGSLYPTSTKPEATHCPHAVLAQARAELRLPIVAIGGITPDNAASVLAAGADFVAAIGGVFDQPSIFESAARYARLFHSRRKESHV